MSEELHGYLRHERDRIRLTLDALRSGQLEVWDVGSQQRRNISDEHAEQLAQQLASTEALMVQWGVRDD